MARTGKIARLPLSIREELNERLLDNESGTTLLPWLNSLPEAKTVLKAFANVPISDANLSEWRAGGFAEWMDDQSKIHKVRKLGEISLRLAKAAGGNLSEGLLAIAAGKVQEALEAAATQVEYNDDDEPVLPAAELGKIVAALTSIRSLEIESQKLDLKRTEVAHKGEALQLEKKKFQRTTAALFIEWAVDEDAKNIATSDLAADAKLEALGQHLFGNAWE